MTCWDIIDAYALRSLGIGERLLPRSDFNLCQQFVLIGSGMLWNIYFGTLALFGGFFAATVVALGKASHNPVVAKLADWFILLFRGSPLFIQFFFAYFAFLALKNAAPIFAPFSAAWLGALVVLFLNTTAYSAEIFFGALRSIPKGDIEAADAYGMQGWRRFRRLTWPTMLRLAWPAYTNEAIFLFHSTTLVFMSGFPASRQQGDALYYAQYFADKTFNPFVPYPILAGYFIILTLVVIGLFGILNKRLNRHLPLENRRKIRLRPQLIR